jgi:hypothetical protein
VSRAKLISPWPVDFVSFPELPARYSRRTRPGEVSVEI